MKIQVVRGARGLSLSVKLSDHSSLRIAGPKGGGEIIHVFDIDMSDFQTRKVLLDELKEAGPLTS